MQGIPLAQSVPAFAHELRENDRCKGTIEKYLRDVRAFLLWLRDDDLSKERSVAWKEYLIQAGYMPATINSMLSSLNSFLRFVRREDCTVRFLRVQRRTFCDPARELDKEDYSRLLAESERCGNRRLALLMETIGATGIRVSELKYITLEAVQKGQAVILLKGKIRTILLPSRLCAKLKQYAKKEKIASGEIFLTKSKKSLSRKQIWKEMKQLCVRAGIEPQKVFPHNLRHLFATTFYHSCGDIVKLADILGHSSLETTRIYLISTGVEHQRQLERLGLIR